METGQKYNIVYADPPWRYDNKRVQGGAEKHYGTMSTEEICGLPEIGRASCRERV